MAPAATPAKSCGSGRSGSPALFTNTCEISLEKVNRTPKPKQQSPITAGLLCRMFALDQNSGVARNFQ